ncbi:MULTISPECIES: hypothetical protein [Actinosynnema]|uniref:hypothetical protein n=1 Tax=Actinosynnema TaxID=40566 RepID=UPI0020A5DC04|nr:hypothetical protein [Actinosynnema pretiosum]
MTWLIAYFPGDPLRAVDPAAPASIRVVPTAEVTAYRELVDCDPAWVASTWEHLAQAGPRLLQAPQAVRVWEVAAALARHRLDADVTSLITHGQLEAWAGRTLTGHDLARICEAIPNSSIPEAFGIIVHSMDSQDAEEIADLRGSMVDGYDAERVNRVLGRISEVSGLPVVCVWAYRDAVGFGGDSGFYIEIDGRLHHCAGELWRWLNTPEDLPDAPTAPGPPSSWVGALSDLHEDRLAHDDGNHNYALRDDLDAAEDSRPDQRLLALAEALHVDPLDLDDTVHDLVDKSASAINNGGLDKQIPFLVDQLGEVATEQLLSRHLIEAKAAATVLGDLLDD